MCKQNGRCYRHFDDEFVSFHKHQVTSCLVNLTLTAYAHFKTCPSLHVYLNDFTFSWMLSHSVKLFFALIVSSAALPCSYMTLPLLPTVNSKPLQHSTLMACFKIACDYTNFTCDHMDFTCDHINFTCDFGTWHVEGKGQNDPKSVAHTWVRMNLLSSSSSTK